MQTQKFEVLYDFLDRAVKSKKYPENTAISVKTALKLFEKELSEEESNSVDEFKKNIEHIYSRVFSKNKNFSAGSLATYKSRVLKVVNDYQKYGIEPAKMASWSPKITIRSKRKLPNAHSKDDQDIQIAKEEANLTQIGFNRIELSLRSDCKCTIVVPVDMTAIECSKIKAVLDSLSLK